MKKIITVDGNEACSYTAYMFTEVAGIYPITPSSPMAEHMDEWSNQHRLNLFQDEVKVVEMQSELGAAGMVHGSLQAGLLTTTFTASQGLLLMLPNMYKIAGEMLPGVIHVAARSLSTHALSILGDHQDIYATRMTGFALLASSSVQDAAYLSGIAHLSAIDSSLPFLHFFDGFRTSHEINKIEVLEKEDFKKLLNEKALKRFRNKALDPLNPFTRGVNQNDDIYFQNMEARNLEYDQLPDIVNSYMEKLNKIAGTDYKPFNYYGKSHAKKVIVAMGSVTDTIKEYIDGIDEEIGLIEVHLYRPFSVEYLNNVLPNTVEKIAVLDRTKEAGSREPLYLDVVSALKDRSIQIVGGRYGLASKNTTPAQIKAVYDMLDNPKENFTIGIEDDITHLSLEISNFQMDDTDEMLIYGYGSDGMVSASKSLIQLIGNSTNKYVQGYFEYDSKKSGGVTVSHLRFSNKKIRKPYYVENPKIVVVSKESYLKEFELFSNMKENGICIINTIFNQQELNEVINEKNKKDLREKNIQVYTANAYLLARQTGLDNKISMIMETIILNLTDFMDFEKAKEQLNEYVTKKFEKKGASIVKNNQEAIRRSTEIIQEIKIETSDLNFTKEKETFYEMLQKRKGNQLPVSSFLNHKDGTFYPEKISKHAISDTVPKWISSHCIRCNRCSFVCPHSVIRTFLINEEEYLQLPKKIKERCIRPLDKNLMDYYFIVSISIQNCTGCGLCFNTCPGFKQQKALIMEDIHKQKEEQDIFDYLEKHISDKNISISNKVIKSQFRKPKIEFPGACLGCGQPAYIKVLTQICGENMIIANATGCSSIYGGSIPDLPYHLPWASSLFEDNAEYGYGIVLANQTMKNRIRKIMMENMDNPNNQLFQEWLKNPDDFKTTQFVYENLDDHTLPKELLEIKNYILPKNIWMVGGDGWAYDIGFSGIDHVLASNDNVNILVLNTEVYSNTGGQSSKASQKGSLASFTTSGKRSNAKDLARICLSYPHVYVAQVNLASNMNQLVRVFKEANEYQGPSIIIAYTPCISHGIKGGMNHSLEMEILASKCGYFPIFHYHPLENKFYLDSKNPDFDLYEEFLMNQTRYRMLKKVNPTQANLLLEENKTFAKERFEYYKMLSER